MPKETYNGHRYIAEKMDAFISVASIYGDGPGRIVRRLYEGVIGGRVV